MIAVFFFFFIWRVELISIIKIYRQCLEVYCDDAFKVENFRKWLIFWKWPNGQPWRSSQQSGQYTKGACKRSACRRTDINSHGRHNFSSTRNTWVALRNCVRQCQSLQGSDFPRVKIFKFVPRWAEWDEFDK